MCIALLAFGCGTFGDSGKSDGTEVEVRQIPGKAEYTVFGPHRLRAILAITGLPEGASEEDAAAARAGGYTGPVQWTLGGEFTFGTSAHRILEPVITVNNSKPEHVDILLTVITPAEEITNITITRAVLNASFTASPQATFRVRVEEKKQ
jgi:hypothetical protein